MARPSVVGCGVPTDNQIETPEPIAQLMRDHREIEAQVTELERAAENLESVAGRQTALATVNAVVDFFAGSGVGARHHAYEEQVLFPRLRELDDFAQAIGALEFQHKMNDDTYAELCDAVQAGDTSRIALAAPRLADMHRAHIMAEERALFPLLATKLPADALAELAGALPPR